MKTRSKAFSLVELVVVIVIIGIIAAMAIPRLSRGTAGAGDSALAGNLATMRTAINLYSAEHNNKFPTQAKFTEQLTKFTNANGDDNPSRSSSYPFGPYLMAIPPCPVGSQATPSAVAFDSTVGAIPTPTADTGGWIYNPGTGEFRANTNAADASTKPYFNY